MSEYTRYDFSESLDRVRFDASQVCQVVQAWGLCLEGYADWEGGFVMRLRDGRFAYLSGWCDTSGWGCQDGADLVYADSLEGLGLPTDVAWDLNPADLNLWIAKGCLDSDTV